MDEIDVSIHTHRPPTTRSYQTLNFNWGTLIMTWTVQQSRFRDGRHCSRHEEHSCQAVRVWYAAERSTITLTLRLKKKGFQSSESCREQKSLVPPPFTCVCNVACERKHNPGNVARNIRRKKVAEAKVISSCCMSIKVGACLVVSRLRLLRKVAWTTRISGLKLPWIQNSTEVMSR